MTIEDSENETDIVEREPPEALTDFLLDLLDVAPKMNVATIGAGKRIARRLEDAGCSTTSIPSVAPLLQQILALHESGHFDRILALPRFGGRISLATMPPSGWESMGLSAEEDLLLAHTVDQLAPHGVLVVLVPNGLLTSLRRMPLRKLLIDHGLVLAAALERGSVLGSFGVSFGLLVVRRDHVAPRRQITLVNSSAKADIPPKELIERALKNTSEAMDGIIRLDVERLEPPFRIDPQYYDPAYLAIHAPKGYEDQELGAVAEIRGGYPLVRELRLDSKPADAEAIPYLQVRHIQPDGSIASNHIWVKTADVPNHNRYAAHPGDILMTVSGTIGKVAIVPESFTTGVLFDTSLRRIRPTSDLITPNDIYRFLRSDLGQLQCRRLTGGTAIPYISSADLASVRIFLPSTMPSNDGTTKHSPPESSTIGDKTNQSEAVLIADMLEERVIKFLRNLDPEDRSWPTTVTRILNEITRDLGPKPLDRTVLEDFPAPIAIPYRRFLMARFNEYERLDRMINLVESCVYFVFHVLITEFHEGNWQDNIVLTRDAASAAKGRQSIDYRLKFIGEVLTHAENESGATKLFIPELLKCRIVQIGDKLRTEVRNPISHSAPGSEPYVRSVVERHLSDVEALLESLRPLSNYSLCRIRRHYFKDGRWHNQAEVYRGAEYDINVQEDISSDSSELSPSIEAECDHLVLLNPDGDVLDLHPYYQIYFGDETCRESHLIYLKYRRSSEAVFESVRNGLEVSLPDVQGLHPVDDASVAGLGLPRDAS